MTNFFSELQSPHDCGKLSACNYIQQEQISDTVGRLTVAGTETGLAALIEAANS